MIRNSSEDMDQGSVLIGSHELNMKSQQLYGGSNCPFLRYKYKATCCIIQHKQIIKTAFCGALIALVFFGTLFGIYMLFREPPFDIGANFPEIGKNRTSPNQYQKEKAKQHDISIESLQIAKQYLKLGLQQPSYNLIWKQKQYYEKKYGIYKTLKTDLNGIQFPFCIVVPSYNNVQNKRYLLALKTVLRQQYSNYHIVYIDDASIDGTGKLVQKFIDQNNVKDKIKLIINKENQGPLVNQYGAAMNHCGQQQIFMLIDGDDGLIGTQTLKLLNHIYQTTDSWFVYGNYIHIDNQQIGICKKIPDLILEMGTYRYQNYVSDWITSHPKTFYNKLFHLMSKSNLMDRGKDEKETHLFKVNADRAMLYPVVEMSGTKVRYVPQILYTYLASTPYSEGKKSGDQDRALRIITSFQKQKRLKQLFTKDQCQQSRQYIRQKILKDRENQKKF